MPKVSHAQGIECSLDIPAALVKDLIAKQPLIEEFAAQMKIEGTAALSGDPIPVRFTAIQGPGGGFGFSQLQATIAINFLNQAYAPTGLVFAQCGEINEIWDDRIKASEEVDQFITSFAYATGTIELYLKPSIPLPYAPIPDQAYQQGNPNWPAVGVFQHTNFIKLNGPPDLGVNFIHETGHHFGLLHTHMMSSTPYLDPPPATANDFPYPVLGPNGQIIPTWWGRELAIRADQPVGSKDHPTINYNAAGDLLEDTPADCASFLSLFPGCPFTAQNPGCDFNSTLTYVDYNGDPINPPPGGFSLGRNYMSYWRLDCVNQFSPKQIEKLQFYAQTVRGPIYTQDRCGTFTDKVELEGTANGLHNVSIRVRHATSSQKCNVTSSRMGDFSGLLHQDNLNTHQYHNGKKSSLNFPNDPLKVHYGHTRCEWKRGVNVGDLRLISDHILGISPLINGYRIIAADANQSKTVTTFDIVELRKLILGIYWDFLPNQEQPWRYYPEFVPQNFANQFNVNPFGVLAGAYLDQGWAYAIPNAGQRGFDASKIGDVNFSWLGSPDCPNEIIEPGGDGEPGGGGASLDVPTTGLAQNDVVALTVKTQAAQPLDAFQLGLKIPAAQFEILDVLTNSLPNYTKADHFGLNLSDQDAFTTAWFNESGNPVSLPSGSTLFTIVVKAKQAIPNLQSSISLDNAVTPSVFFQSANTVTTSTVGLSMQVGPAVGHRSVDAETNASNLGELRCEPNPMQNTLNITFLNKSLATQGLLTIMDVAGKTVFQQNMQLSKGENKLTVDALGSIPSGVYILSLQVKDVAFTSKVLKN